MDAVPQFFCDLEITRSSDHCFLSKVAIFQLEGVFCARLLLADFRLLRKATFDRILPVATVSYVPVSTGCGRQKPAKRSQSDAPRKSGPIHFVELFATRLHDELSPVELPSRVTP